MATQLNYKIVGRKAVPGNPHLEDVHIEWTCPGKPATADQLTVEKGTPDSKVMEEMEKKRDRLAAALGVKE